MAIRIFIVTIGLLVLIGVLGGLKVSQFQAMAQAGASMVPPPEVVSSQAVKRENWEQVRRSVGSLEAVRGVTVTADFSGRVDSVLFVSGAEIKKGGLLLQQNTDAEQAQLRAAQANLALAKANLTRSKELLAKRVASQSQYDAADAEYKAAQAQVENIEVTIAKKTISAPFDGRLGIRQVNLGQDIQQGEPIVSLQADEEMLINFSLPQKDLAVLSLGLVVRVTTDAVPGREYTGIITAINPEVNVKSRNVLVQAKLNNDNHKSLMPGMFASVVVVLPKQRSVLSVPATAISYATYGDSVFVLHEEKNEAGNAAVVATQQFVQLGEARGDHIEILKGITEGQAVATAGIFKLRNGASVTINNDVVPAFETNPNPADR